jgi:hypothetical protein
VDGRGNQSEEYHVDWDTYGNHSQRHRDVAVGDA